MLERLKWWAGLWLVGALWGLAVGCSEEASVREVGDAQAADAGEGAAGDVGAEPGGDAAPDAGPVGPTLSVVAGGFSEGHGDGPASAARFDGQVCAALDAAGDRLLVADAFSGTLRAVALADGATSTVAGRPYELAVLDGPAGEARLSSPRGCAVGPDGAVWIADDGALRRLDPVSGALETVAGRGGAPGFADGPAEGARLGYLVHHLLVSADGAAVYLADRSNDRVRVFEVGTGTVRTVAGGTSGLDEVGGGPPRLDGPGGLAWWGTRLVLMDTFGGRLWSFVPETGVGRVEASGLSGAQGVAVVGDTAYVAGFEGLVTAVDLATGAARPAFGRAGDTAPRDGGPAQARLGGAFAPLVHDPVRNLLYYNDIQANSVRAISRAEGAVLTLAGPRPPGAPRGGPAAAARFGALMDGVGDGARWFLADAGGPQVWRLVDGEVTGLFGGRAREADGPLAEAGAVAPRALALDEAGGRLFVVDGRRLRVVDLGAGTVRTLEAAGAAIGPIEGLDFGGDGLLYVAAASGIWAVDAAGEARRVAQAMDADGISYSPADVAWLEDGSLWVADADSSLLLRVVDGALAVAAGVPGESGPGDGPAGRLAGPVGLARRGDGTLLVVDAENHRIRGFDPQSGALSTWIGHPVRRSGLGHREPVAWGAVALRRPAAVAVAGGVALVVSEGAVLLSEGALP